MKPKSSPNGNFNAAHLSDIQKAVLIDKETEPPFSGEYLTCNDDGSYNCGLCGNKLFTSDTKYDSSCGWPSFWNAVNNSVKLKQDLSHGMTRTEVVCASCGGHLGHVFDDGPDDKGGKRFCINSASLQFDPKTKNPQDGQSSR